MGSFGKRSAVLEAGQHNPIADVDLSVSGTGIQRAAQIREMLAGFQPATLALVVEKG